LLAHDNYSFIITYLFHSNLTRIITKNIACIGEKIVYANAQIQKLLYYAILSTNKQPKELI